MDTQRGAAQAHTPPDTHAPTQGQELAQAQKPRRKVYVSILAPTPPPPKGVGKNN